LLALLLLSSFWSATLVSELFLDVSDVVATKSAILHGLVLLVPCMAALHVTGSRIAGASSGPLIVKKRRILRLMGANAALVLVPSAIGLYVLSRDGSLEPPFLALQALELVAGTLNITLLVMNIHAGLKLAGRLRRRPNVAASTG
jgi:hypothetical protein